MPIPTAHRTLNTSNSSRTCQAGSKVSTSCPRDSSSVAVSSTAARLTGSTSTSASGGSLEQPMRSRPGSLSTALANGCAGSGAQLASPSS